MRTSALGPHLRRRLRRRTVWLAVLGFTLAFALIEGYRTAFPAGTGPLLWARTFITAFLICFSYGFLSPLPWRWTGDDRPRAPLLRGALQAFLWNAVLVSLLILFDAGLRGAAGYTGVRMPDGSIMKVSLGEIWRMNMLFAVPFMSFIGATIAHGELTEEEKRAAEAKLKEAQGVLLRGQLSPHVLFNSLNALAELVRHDPVRAEEALLDLAELYRALLQHGDRISAPLGEERRLVERYLAVEQLRLGARLRLSWAWDANIDDLQIPPFLLQPLVENALKHGIAGSSEGGELRIEAREELHGLRLRVANTGQATPLVLGTGIGLRNLEARLHLAYGPHAWFQLRTEAPWTVAEVRIQSPDLWRQL
jgi:two-component system sensor histidine kinase AlgZ